MIYLSLKDLKHKTWEECLLKIKYQIRELYIENMGLYEELQRVDKQDFDRILNLDTYANYEDSLKYLMRYLFEYFKKKVIILLDEYDTPIVSAYENGYYQEAMNFF